MRYLNLPVCHDAIRHATTQRPRGPENFNFSCSLLIIFQSKLRIIVSHLNRLGKAFMENPMENPWVYDDCDVGAGGFETLGLPGNTEIINTQRTAPIVKQHYLLAHGKDFLESMADNQQAADHIIQKARTAIGISFDWEHLDSEEIGRMGKIIERIRVLCPELTISTYINPKEVVTHTESPVAAAYNGFLDTLKNVNGCALIPAYTYLKKEQVSDKKKEHGVNITHAIDLAQLIKDRHQGLPYKFLVGIHEFEYENHEHLLRLTLEKIQHSGLRMLPDAIYNLSGRYALTAGEVNILRQYGSF